MSRASSPRPPQPARTRRFGGAVPFGSAVRQARSDSAPLSVAMIVIALVTFVTAIIPRAAERVATDEIRTAVADPSARADVVANVPLWEDWAVERPLLTGTAEDSYWVAQYLASGLPQVFSPPVTVIDSRQLRTDMLEDGPGYVRLVYVDADGPPDVVWIDGKSPEETEDAFDTAVAGLTFPVEVGLSEDVAEALDVEVGDTFYASDLNGPPVSLMVSGVFRPVEANAPEWDVVPTLVEPVVVSGFAARVELSAMLSADSLPCARLALEKGSLARTYTFTIKPEDLNASNAAATATSIRRIAAGSDDLGASWLGTTVRTRLDSVLDAAIARVDSANAQGSLILAGVLATALLVVLLAAGLVTQRRFSILAHHRAHGASLPAIGAALAVESAVIAALGGGIGLAVARAVLPGPTSWSWVAPPLILAALAGPVSGVWAASRRTAPPPARRLDLRPGIRSAAARRLSLEVAVLVLTVGSFAALRSRGVTASGATLGADLVVLAAPVLASVAVSLVLLRVLPPTVRWVRRIAGRARGATPVLAASRTRIAGLPLVSFVLATSLVTTALAIDATVRSGEITGSWQSVGADVVAATSSDLGLSSEIETLAGAPGVDAVAAAHVATGTQLLGDSVDLAVRVVAVDSADVEALLADSPLADAPQLALLTDPPEGLEAASVPVLTTGVPSGASGLSLRWQGQVVPLTSVGAAPAIPGEGLSAGPTVVVDRQVLEQAMGISLPPTVVWVDGEGAEAAVRSLPGLGDATITTRSDWLEARRTAPMTEAFGNLLVGAVAVLMALAALAVYLVAAASARGRATALARFRVLGLPRRQSDRVAVGELVAPVLVGSVVGTVTGVGLAALLVGPMDLAVLTGQLSAPTLVLPWWCWMSVPVLVVAVLIAVAVELAGHRRERLGQVMRAS